MFVMHISISCMHSERGTRDDDGREGEDASLLPVKPKVRQSRHALTVDGKTRGEKKQEDSGGEEGQGKGCLSGSRVDPVTDIVKL